MLHIENSEYYTIKFTINGKELEKTVPSHMRLLDLLREELLLTGSKEVCGEGECGACTILLDEKIVNSCLILAVEVSGSEIITIEGVSKDDSLTKLQEEFLQKHSVQCGYCIPGMIFSGDHTLQNNTSPSRQDIRDDLSGNMCRCTGYKKIIDAIESTSKSEHSS